MEQTDEDRLTAALLDQFLPAGDDVHGMQTAMNALVAVAARVIWVYAEDEAEDLRALLVQFEERLRDRVLNHPPRFILLR